MLRLVADVSAMRQIFAPFSSAPLALTGDRTGFIRSIGG
jgi:hypothetical protein